MAKTTKKTAGKKKRASRPGELKAEKFTTRKALLALDGPTAFLGSSRAVTIALHCANTVLGNLPRTLAQLGVNGLLFQRCVAQSVRNAGFVIAPAAVPNAPANTLIDVVNAIQTAPSK